jgi:hypothetical protein
MAVIKLNASGQVILRGGLPSCTCCGSCSISWDTSVYSGQNNGNPWTVSNSGSRLRVDLEDSEICGGPNNNTQTGTATATIAVVGADVALGFSFSGISEMQDTGYENISFYLDAVLVASATSPGGSLGCEMGASIVTYHVAPPYILTAGAHTMEIIFDSGDALYHVDSYYQADFTCTTAPP